MPCITPLEPPFAPAVAARFARLLPAGTTPPALFRAVARNEALFVHLVDIGLLGPTGLLDRRVLAPPLRELLILRTCVATGNDYEWRLHVGTISQRMGLSAAQIDDTRRAQPSTALWRDDELDAIALVDALVHHRDVPPALHARLRRRHDDAALIEMTLLVGLYTAVAMLVALVRPPLDPYAAPLPAPA